MSSRPQLPGDEHLQDHQRVPAAVPFIGTAYSVDTASNSLGSKKFALTIAALLLIVILIILLGKLL